MACAKHLCKSTLSLVSLTNFSNFLSTIQWFLSQEPLLWGEWLAVYLHSIPSSLLNSSLMSEVNSVPLSLSTCLMGTPKPKPFTPMTQCLYTAVITVSASLSLISTPFMYLKLVNNVKNVLITIPSVLRMLLFQINCIISLKFMALGGELYGLADWTRFCWQLVHFSITSSMMFVNEGCHFPPSVNIVVNCLICMWPCVTCIFSMYSLFVTADVVYVLCCGDVNWVPRMGGALLPKMTWNVICSGLYPVTFIVNSLITCVSMSFKKSCVFVIPSPPVPPTGWMSC